ncbi:hypothetical protein WJX73_003422 [Symbiochloris irregularis]|uniref:Beta-glucosidase n=1 Tax=Symbiochloris irregularis TaxID=706552 RepID=A0AAW1PQT4_9CHLO
MNGGESDYEMVDLDRPNGDGADTDKAVTSGSAADDWQFMVGVAISVYQNSGGPNNQWERFEHEKKWFGRPTIAGGAVCGLAADFWDRYEEDIQRAADLNSNCFRLSLEWCRLEPEQGKFDVQAVQRYHDILDCLIRHRMQPVITLHHFVHPTWFEDLGAFTQAENTQHFVNFATKAFKEYGSKVHAWATFNEPNVMMFCGWIYGAFPPAKLANFSAGGKHLLNQLRAHTAVYHAIKALPGGDKARIGLVHNWLRYEPLSKDGFSAVYVKPLCSWMESVWANQLIIEYFTTGKFHFPVPFGSAIHAQEDRVPPTDWIGINYYGRVAINWKCQPSCHPGETMTDMPYPLYAPGLYDGIKALSEIGKPIYITETGIANEKEDLKPQFFETYFAQMERAVKDGYDLRGIMYWTLIDNFEWAEGWTIKFGLYAWAQGGSQERIMRKTTPMLADIYKGLPDKMRGHWDNRKMPTEQGRAPPDSLMNSRHPLVEKNS